MLKSKMMLNSGDLIQVERGTVLMKQGAIGHCAYLLLQGQLLVEKELENGEKVVIAQITPINLVGEFAIFDEMPRSATVTVLEDAKLIELKKHRLKTMIRKSPEIAEVVIKLLCNKLRRM